LSTGPPVTEPQTHEQLPNSHEIKI
jgi:hypothetical protein